MVMHWLITGGCGFIGSSLIQQIIEHDRKARIRVFDNLSVGTREDLAEVCDFIELSADEIKANPICESAVSCQLIVGDIRNVEIAQKVVVGVDVIVHLAANTGVGPSVDNPRLDCITNVVGTFNMLEAARLNNVKRFVFASSGAPVGEVEPPIHEELAPHPVSPYGASKLAGEGYCSSYSRTFGIDTVVLRFGNVYGPRSKNKASVVAKFIKQAIKGKVLEVYGRGDQTRDFIYIKDLVYAIELAASKPGVGGEVFQIATSAETTVNEIVDLLVSTLAEHGIKNIEVVHAETRLGDVERNYSDTTKANRILGWKNQTKLINGLKDTAKWFLSRLPR